MPKIKRDTLNFSTWLRLLLQIFSKGWAALDQAPHFARRPSSPWALRHHRSRFKFSPSLVLYLILGILIACGFWLIFFTFVLPVNRTGICSKGSSAQTQVIQGRDVLPIPDLPAVLLNQTHIRNEILRDLRKNYPQAQGSIHVRVKIDRSGRYLTHQVIESTSTELELALSNHLYKVDCLPALYGGQAVNTWIAFRLYF